MDWGSWFAMGGYGGYVWSAYAIAGVVLLLNVCLPLRSLRRIRRQEQKKKSR